MRGDVQLEAYDALPPQLQAALQAGAAKIAVSRSPKVVEMGEVARRRRASCDRLASMGVWTPSGQRPPGRSPSVCSDGTEASLAAGGVRPAPLFGDGDTPPDGILRGAAILASPYFASACFGPCLGPQKHAAIATTAAATHRRDQHMHIAAAAEAAQPFLPAVGEASQSSQIAEQQPRSRLPRELHHRLQSLEHTAYKCDLERQMGRIVDGLRSERRIIVHLKAAALSHTLNQQKMRASPSIMLSAMRSEAGARRREWLDPCICHACVMTMPLPCPCCTHAVPMLPCLSCF